MVVPFDRFVSDQEIAEDYRRFDKLIGDLCDVLFHVLTTGRVSSSEERFQEPENDPNFRGRSIGNGNDSQRMNHQIINRSSNRDGPNGMYPDLLSNIYGHTKGSILGNSRR